MIKVLCIGIEGERERVGREGRYKCGVIGVL